MKKRFAMFLLVIAVVSAMASTASAKAFDGGWVFGRSPDKVQVR